MLKFVTVLSALALWTGCATYQYADDVKLISFDDHPTKGKAVGNITGEDCMWRVFGYELREPPSVDKAFIAARRSETRSIRYVNKVSTKPSGFDAGIVGKQCIVVTGVGYE